MPNPLIAMNDLIVVIPGVIGSTLLDRNGNELWGVKFGTIAKSILHLGKNFEALRLPQGIGDNPAPDGIRPGEVIESPHFISKLFGDHGYGQLLTWLTNTFDLRLASSGVPGNLIVFPYDWRLSNRVTGKRIETELVPLLQTWRKTSGNPDAKFRFICHSMGGLVARWFTEVMGGRELTRQLITIGTPHLGAPEAIVKLSNGFDPGFGPLKLKLTDIVRSLPSVYQLLPTYPCVASSNGPKRIQQESIADLDNTMRDDALAFHKKILERAQVHTTTDYRIFALKGIAQPTTTGVLPKEGRLEPLLTLGDLDWAGDGTVPRLSSHPPEWQDDAYAATFGQQHTMLQSDSNLHRQLFSILTASMVPKYAAAQNLFGLDVPEIIQAGGPLTLTVTSANGDDSLPLQAALIDEKGNPVGKALMKNMGKGHYERRFENVPPGLISVRIESCVPSHPIDSVTGSTMVWDPSLTL